MSIPIRELLTTGSQVADTTITLGSGTAIGDTLVAVHGNDFYTLAGMLAPTGTAASNWTHQLSFDGGTNFSHFRAWTAPVTTAGAQTVIFHQDVGSTDADQLCAVWVLQDGPTWDGGATTSAGSGSSTWAAASVTPISGQTDDLLFALWANNDGGSATWNVVSYPGAPFSGFTEVDVGTFVTFGGGTEQLTSGGATGTRTLTTSTAAAWCAISFLMKATGAPAAPQPVALQAAGPFPAF